MSAKQSVKGIKLNGWAWSSSSSVSAPRRSDWGILPAEISEFSWAAGGDITGNQGQGQGGQGQGQAAGVDWAGDPMLKASFVEGLGSMGPAKAQAKAQAKGQGLAYHGKGAVAMVPPAHTYSIPASLGAWGNDTVDTGAGAGAVGAFWVEGAAVDRLSIRAAMGGRAYPVGPLLMAAMGHCDLCMVRRLVGRLARKMARDGKLLSDTMASEGEGAGLVAVVAWRNGQDQDGSERGAGGVAWRAMVRAVASDAMGESIESWRRADGVDAWDCLVGSALPLPPLVGDGSREERASRLLFERARAKRAGLLSRRVDSLKASLGGRGQAGGGHRQDPGGGGAAAPRCVLGCCGGPGGFSPWWTREQGQRWRSAIPSCSAAWVPCPVHGAHGRTKGASGGAWRLCAFLSGSVVCLGLSAGSLSASP